MKLKKKLKPRPCPFCGSKNVKAVIDVFNYYVECFDCNVTGPRAIPDYKKLREKAVRLWNGEESVD